ncbi:hypothetical protein J2857_000510 [Neorhizobium galegae]|nr:hypothetical protein [Neorhizobium galegae]MBP2557759.1 hypothetical protein [Neorhizobium galegae]
MTIEFFVSFGMPAIIGIIAYTRIACTNGISTASTNPANPASDSRAA